MKAFKLIIVFVVLLFAQGVFSQGYEFDHERGEHWRHTQDANGRHWYGWENEDGSWTWQPDYPGSTWPPDIDWGDGGSGDEGWGDDYGDDWWDEWWDDWENDIWDDWWDDPWEDWVWDDYFAGGSNEIDCPEIYHRTRKAPNRERVIIAIGEEMTLRIRNRCDADVNWEIEGPGVFTSPDDEREVSLQATYEAGIIAVTANLTNLCAECDGPVSTLEIEFEVIIPEGIFIERINAPTGETGIHERKRVSAGLLATIYILPDNVNFYNVRFQEGNAVGVINGEYFTPANIVDHIPSLPVQASDMVFLDKGTRLPNADQVEFKFWCEDNDDHDPNVFGSYSFEINQYYLDESNVPNDVWRPFDILNQQFFNVPTIPDNPRNATRKRSQLTNEQASINYNLLDLTTTFQLDSLLGCD